MQVYSTVVYGDIRLEPVRYTIREEVGGWFRRRKFYVASEYAEIGPYSERQIQEYFREIADAKAMMSYP